MGWLARLFGRERRNRPASKVRRDSREVPPAAPPEAADDPDWAWRTLVAWWDRTEANIPIGGASDDAIAALEQRYDIVLPPDFRAYIRNACPSAEEMDWETGTWWPLDRLSNIPDGYEHPPGKAVRDQARRYLLFVDHCIWCWAWAICCEKGPDWGKVVASFGPDSDKVVAASFSDFVAGYIADPYGMT